MTKDRTIFCVTKHYLPIYNQRKDLTNYEDFSYQYCSFYQAIKLSVQTFGLSEKSSTLSKPILQTIS